MKGRNIDVISDSGLIQKILDGENHYFKFLVERHQGTVASICFVLLKDANDAEEIGQKVFIRFYKSLSKFQGKASLKTYLSKITTNLCINELKRKGKWINRYKDISTHIETRGTREYELGSDYKGALEVAMQKLKIDEKLIITLRSINGHSIKETSQIMGIKQGTVMSKLSRAIEKLKKVLIEIGYENE